MEQTIDSTHCTSRGFGTSRRGPVFAHAVPLIDREREMGELRTALADALAGDGRIVLLGGEPGIGKTRLASVIAEEAATRDVPVWWGRGWEDGSAPAFWPWNLALRRGIDHGGHDDVVAAAAPWADELASVFPALRDHMALPPSERRDADGARFQLFDAVSRFLAAIARSSGLVVVLDDVHWADRPSLKLLEFIASDLADARLLVVATYRDTEIDAAHPFHATLSRLARESCARRLLVGGLEPEHCARWIALAGVEGDATALHRETNGNPFFLGEIVHLLADADDVERVPFGVREVIARRLERLGADCRTTLAAAALAGDTIDAALLGDVLDDTAVADHLERAVRDRILVASATRAGEYAFAHALIRRVLVDEIAPTTRAAWHARIADALELRVTTCEAATTELVYHLAAASTPDTLRKAFDYACRGGAQAARGLGWEEAVRLYEIALDVGRRAGLLDASRTIDLRLALARAYRGAGDVPAARACCDEVLAACRRTPNPTAVARAALIHAGTMPEWGRVEPAVRAVLEEACRLAPSIDGALRARLYSRLAGDLIAANEVDQATRVFALCDDAAASARKANDPGALAIALTGTYYATAILGVVPDSMPSTHDILEAAEAGGEHEYVAAIRYARAVTLLAIDEPDGFSGEVDDMATAAAATRIPEAIWLRDALAALRATVQGRFDEARDAMDRAFATGRRMHVPSADHVHTSQRIMWHALRGRLGDIADEIETCVATQAGGAGWRPFRGLARFASGDHVGARAELDDLLATGLAPATRGVMARCYLAGLAALCVTLRDREHAPKLYERIARRPDAWCIDGVQTLGPWALSLGMLARLCDRPEDAERHFEDAIRLGRRMGSTPVVARAQSMLASLRLASNPNADERTRIASLLAEAGQSARELELMDVVTRVERLQAKLGATTVDDAGLNTFHNDVDVWSIQFAGRLIRLKDGKGPRYLASLLASPGREIHVLQFAAPAGPTSRVHAQDGLSVGQASGAVEDAPDQRARREYRERIADLRAEIDEADEFADTGRAERLRAELDQLMGQLAGRFGGHARRVGASETARKAVTKVLRTQIGKLLEVHPALGRHLRDTIRMGTVCVYAPPTPVAWDVTFAASSK